MSTLPCQECGGRCCQYASVVLAREDENSVELLPWLLDHEGVRVYVSEDGFWVVQFPARRSHLSPKGFCLRYQERPAICREYGEDGRCDYPQETGVLIAWESAEEYLAWREPGETVFDPFCETGTTVVVAERLGRQAWGTEQNPEYVTYATERIARAREQGTLPLVEAAP